MWCAWSMVGSPTLLQFSTLFGASRPSGHPPQRWHKIVEKDLLALKLPTNMHEVEALCLMRGWWRSMVYKITHPDATGIRYRRRRVPSQSQQQRLQLRQQQLQPTPTMAVHSPRMLVGEGWMCGTCGALYRRHELAAACLHTGQLHYGRHLV